MEAGISDYIGSTKDTMPCRTVAGDPEYEQACRQMFEYYVATHKTINPWTSDYEIFRKELPETALYAERSSEITACAFVEDNEVAYIGGKDNGHFKEFAQCLVTFILSQYETVCFESDDCDWAAMTLRSMFQNLDESSYDTYVCDNERAIFRDPCGNTSIPYWKATFISALTKQFQSHVPMRAIRKRRKPNTAKRADPTGLPFPLIPYINISPPRGSNLSVGA